MRRRDGRPAAHGTPDWAAGPRWSNGDHLSPGRCAAGKVLPTRRTAPWGSKRPEPPSPETTTPAVEPLVRSPATGGRSVAILPRFPGALPKYRRAPDRSSRSLGQEARDVHRSAERFICKTLCARELLPPPTVTCITFSSPVSRLQQQNLYAGPG